VRVLRPLLQVWVEGKLTVVDGGYMVEPFCISQSAPATPALAMTMSMIPRGDREAAALKAESWSVQDVTLHLAYWYLQNISQLRGYLDPHIIHLSFSGVLDGGCRSTLVTYALSSSE